MTEVQIKTTVMTIIIEEDNPDLDAKEKPKCPPGQEYPLFSMKCEMLYGGREPPNNACPPTPTPTTDSRRIVPQSFSRHIIQSLLREH